MRLQFVGCGDAFGSGGRFNTCFHVESAGGNFLIDCGASSLIAMKNLVIGLRKPSICATGIIISTAAEDSNGGHGDPEIPVIYCAQMHGCI